MNIMMGKKVIEKIKKKADGYYVGCIIKGFKIIGETRVSYNNGNSYQKGYILKCLDCGVEFIEIAGNINILPHEDLCPMEYYGYDPKGEWINRKHFRNTSHLKRNMGNKKRDNIGIDKRYNGTYRSHIYVHYDKSICDKKTDFVHLIYTKSEEAAIYAYRVAEEIIANEIRKYGKVISIPTMLRREVKNKVYKKFPDELK